MTRHAKNCTAGAVYTYHEKKKDTRASGYGTQAMRLGKDSVKDFDCCCLTLQPCRDPVITPDGYLYDKEAILEYIIHQKKEIARRWKEFDKQKSQDRTEMEELGKAEQKSQVGIFIQKEKSIISKPLNPFHPADASAVAGSSQSVSNMANGHDKKLPSFWIPSLTPESKKAHIKKPDKNVYCPMSGKPMKMKDLFPIKFMPINDPDDKRATIAKTNRYMCAISHDILGNTVPCAVLKTSGYIVTVECVEKIIKKEWLDPLNGSKLAEKDIIYIQMGGTGYSTTNDNLAVAVEKPPIQA